MPASPRTRTTAHPGPHLGLWALHDLHLHNYLRYAALLLTPADAGRAVHDAFDELAGRWPDVLAAASPAACAWQAVRRHVRTLAGPRPLHPVAHLTDPQQDVLLLHLVLGLPQSEVAAVTGTEPAAVHVQIRSLAGARRPA
ncbi:sigma factor-like helix-turn-helix DNA-binding protein [Kitasatospora sp. NPDC088351]|uniref:sigma factor-like helix-turn-helix DNA-binding protein n=1 Tax=unclassified Kitasatospora TaxID=2633591 RepID=UPI00344921CE